MNRKGMVIGIIFLLVFVAIAPIINQSVVKAIKDNNFIEVTTQACGIQGYGDSTVKLNREQYQDLQQYLVELRARLNQTTTREETIPLFKDAVMELNNYGLLPKGMRINQAHHLVTKGYHTMKLPRVVVDTIRRQPSNNVTNSFCLLAGYSNGTEMVTLFQSTVVLGSLLIGELLYNLRLPPLLYLLIVIVLLGITTVFYELDYLRPLVLWSDIYIHEGSGFLSTMGLGGRETWSGSFGGKISGFSGIKILLNLQEPTQYFYLGSAFLVNVSSELV